MDSNNNIWAGKMSVKEAAKLYKEMKEELETADEYEQLRRKKAFLITLGFEFDENKMSEIEIEETVKKTFREVVEYIEKKKDGRKM